MIDPDFQRFFRQVQCGVIVIAGVVFILAIWGLVG